MDREANPANLRVTAALLASNGRLFVAQRPSWKKFGLLWEFPGGKVEPGESPEDALVREIREELCLEIEVRDFFRTISHAEKNFAIDLHAYWCAIARGKLCLREHVAYLWARVEELKNLDLTRADRLLVPFLENLPELPDFPNPLPPGETHGGPAAD